MDNETAGKIRGMIRRVVVTKVDDSGGTQTAAATIGQGVELAAVEVLQPFGLAGHAPVDGATALCLMAGGDEGDPVLLPMANPSKRFGGCAEGDVALYNSGGDYVMLRAGGTLEIVIGAAAVLELPAGMVIKAPAVKIEGGRLKVDKDIICHGDVSDKKGSMQEMRDTYNGHSHPSDGTPPNNKME
ncbi:phage baseplate assembly protein domain-containing protein [Candidatus Tokpelaia sp.]|uniref:phage baseplate assembly protein domain-containing protein n=1 Tax=Candidatus Tokpelaia sp. TaxID=2233777 RepID=UPI001238C68F|nr:phage baseplate assembly protein [Candidatus Tokpelaia sp.]KAA6405795.1 hypothetical protein DPQ22_02935 [Candidatus Tokpelaia sp.]